MKYCLSSSKVAQQNKLESDFISKMTVPQCLAYLSALEDILEENEVKDLAAPATKCEVIDSFETLNAVIQCGAIEDSALEMYALNTPGLMEIYGTDVNTFKANLANEVKANEGMLDGLIGDVNTGIIGALIAHARNNLPAVEAQVKICLQMLNNITDEKAKTVTKQHFLRVRSKYLPSEPDYKKAVKALSDTLSAIRSNPKISEDDAVKPLKGTMYWNDAASKKAGNQDTNIKYIVTRILCSWFGVIGNVAERYSFEPSQPVGERGWDSKEKFSAALKDMGKLCTDCEATILKIAKTEGANDAIYLTKWLEKEVVYLGRGITTAVRKLNAGGLVRFISNRYIH